MGGSDVDKMELFALLNIHCLRYKFGILRMLCQNYVYNKLFFIDSKVFPSIHPSLQLTRNLHIYKHQEHSPTRSDNWSDNPHT